MLKPFIFLSIILMLFSCRIEKKFDKEKWVEVADLMTFPNRKYMINDLVKNFQLKGKTYNEIIQLLEQSQSDMNSEHQIFYDVDINYGFDIDPVYTKILLLQFDKDSIVKNFEVREWKK